VTDDQEKQIISFKKINSGIKRLTMRRQCRFYAQWSRTFSSTPTPGRTTDLFFYIALLS